MGDSPSVVLDPFGRDLYCRRFATAATRSNNEDRLWHCRRCNEENNAAARSRKYAPPLVLAQSPRLQSAQAGPGMSCSGGVILGIGADSNGPCSADLQQAGPGEERYLAHAVTRPLRRLIGARLRPFANRYHRTVIGQTRNWLLPYVFISEWG